MNRARENRIKYEFLEDLIDTLDGKIQSYEESAESYKNRAMDEETGELNTSCWEWQNYTEFTDKIQIAQKLKKELEKL